MSKIKTAIIDGSMIAVAVPILGKSREIAEATKVAHGTFFKIDTKILKESFSQNAKGSVMIGICAGLAFATASWASQIMTARKQNSPDIKR